jgi:hypothetical protein
MTRPGGDGEFPLVTLWNLTGGELVNNVLFPPGQTVGWCVASSIGVGLTASGMTCTVRDRHGMWAHISNIGYGAGLNVSASGGVSFFISDADSIYDLAGPFDANSASAGPYSVAVTLQSETGKGTKGQDVTVWSTGGGVSLGPLPVSLVHAQTCTMIIDVWGPGSDQPRPDLPACS